MKTKQDTCIGTTRKYAHQERNLLQLINSVLELTEYVTFH